MSVRKVKWETAKGASTRWLVDYRDQTGERRGKNFVRKRDAEDFAAKVKVEVAAGTHVPESTTVTVSEACDLWLHSCRSRNLETSTLTQYDQHVRLHIKPFLGATKLSRIAVATVRAFEDRLREEGRSQPMVRGIVASLSSVVSDAEERGLIGRNPVRELSRRRGANGKANGRRKLQVGVDIPTPDEIRRIMNNAKGLKKRTCLLSLITTGLRASEFRGLRWDDLDLDPRKPELHVRQRADFRNEIGAPKSSAGTRTIPLTPRVASSLRLWRDRACPKKDGKLVYVFPNGRGNIESTGNIVKRLWWPAQIAAGVTKPVLDDEGQPKHDDEGKPIVKAKYPGLHSLRHFFASWCINRKADGGLELPAKLVQERVGHASVTMTLDRYGHLFPRGDDTSELAKAEKALLG